MSLFNLPNECVYHILSFLLPCDVNAVAQTCKCFHPLANGHLYSRLPNACSSKPIDVLVQRGNVAAMRQLVNYGFDTTICSTSKVHNVCPLYALGRAIELGRLEIVKLFIDKEPGCEKRLEKRNRKIAMPLFILPLFDGQVEVAKYLFSRGTSADMLKTHHDKALCILAASGILPSVKYLVEKRRYDINCFDGTCSAFYMAVKHCHWDVAFYLLRAGAYPLIVEAERDPPKLLPKTHRSKFNKALASALLRLSAEAKAVPGLGWPQLMGAADEKMNALFARRFELHASLVGKDDYGLRNTWLELASNTATGGNERLLRKLFAGEILPDYTRWGLNELLDDPDKGPFGMDGCPILGASVNGHIGCVDAMLEFVYKRSPPKIRYKASWQAFKQAAKTGSIRWSITYSKDTIKYRLWDPVDFDRLRKCFYALCRCAPVSVVKMWLGILAEADIDVADCAPTHTEALGGNKEIKIPVVYLMSECTVENLKPLCKHMGFVIRPRNAILKEVLSRAAEIGNEPLKKYFLNKGFDARLVPAKDSMTISFTYQKGKTTPPKITITEEEWLAELHASELLKATIRFSDGLQHCRQL